MIAVARKRLDLGGSSANGVRSMARGPIGLRPGSKRAHHSRQESACIKGRSLIRLHRAVLRTTAAGKVAAARKKSDAPSTSAAGLSAGTGTNGSSTYEAASHRQKAPGRRMRSKAERLTAREGQVLVQPLP